MKQKVTVVITGHNQKKELIFCLNILKNFKEIENIIIIDMKSTDGTDALLFNSGYDYILFEKNDSGGYAQAWNTVMNNFNMEEIIVFMDPYYIPGKECFVQLLEVLNEDYAGIAGPVSNGFECIQHLEMAEIKNLEEFYNIEKTMRNAKPVQKAMGVFPGFWAVKRSILEKTGFFQPDLLSPLCSLIDVQLKIICKGYQPVICQRAVVYKRPKNCSAEDYDSVYANLDLKILKSKWKINYLSFVPNTHVAGMIQEEKEAEFKVLEIGCNTGATLLEIKNRYPNSQIFGLEINHAAADIANHLFPVRTGNIEDKYIPFEGKFDYIIFADVLEHLKAPQEAIGFCRQKLRENGCILACIPNIMHITVMQKILEDGKFTYTNDGLLDRTHIHLFTYYEIEEMFQQENYDMEDVSYTKLPHLTDVQQNFIKKLLSLSDKVEPHMYEAYQYLIKARKCTD